MAAKSHPVIEEIDWAGESIEEIHDENSSLLTKSNHSIQSDERFQTLRKLWFFHSIRQYVLIEVVVFLYFLSIVTSVSITQYFIFDQIAGKYSAHNISAKHPCEESLNKTDDDIREKIQKEASTMSLYLNMAVGFPAIFPTIFMGGVSDRYGRKVVLMLAISGSLMRSIVYVVVINLKLPIYYLFIGNGIEGLTGSFGTCLMAMFSLIADITEPGKGRAFRITALEAMLAVSSAVGLLMSGYWVAASGYFMPMTFAMGLIVLCLIFTVICIPETLQTHNQTPMSLAIFKNCVQLYTKDTVDHRRWKLIICVFCFFLVISIGLSKSSLNTLYLLNEPFCWQQTKINTFSAVTVAVNWFSILVFLKCFGQKISERMPAIIGCISTMGQLIFFGVAQNDIFIYISAGVGVLSYTVTPVLRSLMSHQVSPVEQGILFASVGVIEISCTAIMGLVSTIVYNITLSFYSGLVFLCMAGFIFIVFILLVILNIGMNRQTGSSVVRTVNIKP